MKARVLFVAMFFVFAAALGFRLERAVKKYQWMTCAHNVEAVAVHMNRCVNDARFISSGKHNSRLSDCSCSFQAGYRAM